MDFSVPSQVLAFLQTSGYFIVFLLLLVEGPLISYVAAFAASLGYFNIWLIGLISIAGNFVADLIYYLIGRIWKKAVIDKYVEGVIQHSRINRIRNLMKDHPGKALTFIKLTPPLPTPGLILSGAVGIPLRTFLFYSFIISSTTATLFVILGYFSGVAFLIIPTYFKYGEYVALVIISLIVIIWLVSKVVLRRYAMKIEKI